MIAVVRFLLLAAILVAFAYAVAAIPGTVVGTIGRIRFETSLAVAVALLIAFGIVLIAAARLVATLLGLPGRFGVAGELRRRRKGEAALTASLLALASGEADDARREASRARRLLGRTPQTLLAVAEADRAAGRLDGAEAGYQALADRADTTFLGLRGLLGVALAKGDHASAATLLAAAEKARPGTSWIRGERFSLACRSGDWAAALDAAPPLAADRAAIAAAAAEQIEATDPGRAAKLAGEAHRSAPGLVPAALVLARGFRRSGREGRAVAVLRETWAVTPHPDLATLALAPVADRLQRVKAAEQFVAKRPGSLEGHLLLGRVSLDAGMWGEARRHASEARALPGGDDRRVLLLLADVAERDTSLSEPERRAAHAEMLRAASSAPTLPAWLCARCGAEQAAWRPVCPHCRSVGSIGWGAVSTGLERPAPAAAEAPLLLGAPTPPALVSPDRPATS